MTTKSGPIEGPTTEASNVTASATFSCACVSPPKYRIKTDIKPLVDSGSRRRIASCTRGRRRGSLTAARIRKSVSGPSADKRIGVSALQKRRRSTQKHRVSKANKPCAASPSSLRSSRAQSRPSHPPEVASLRNAIGAAVPKDTSVPEMKITLALHEQRTMAIPPELPIFVITSLPHSLYHDHDGRSKAACHSWRGCTCTDSQRKSPAYSRLPIKIVQQIFRLLHPDDFNAARHVCRAWFIASLDNSLLKMMLMRKSRCEIATMDTTKRKGGSTSTCEICSEVLTMSRILSQVCPPMLHRTGDGKRLRTQDSNLASRLKDSISSSVKELVPSVSSAWRVDLNEVLSAHTRRNCQLGSSLNLITSVCGKFLLLADGCMIRVFQLGSGTKGSSPGENSPNSDIHLMKSIVCPRKVLSMCMDISAGYFSIGGILGGRTGVIYDYVLGQQGAGHSLLSGHRQASSCLQLAGTTFHQDVCSEEDPPRSIAVCSEWKCVGMLHRMKKPHKTSR